MASNSGSSVWAKTTATPVMPASMASAIRNSGRRQRQMMLRLRGLRAVRVGPPGPRGPPPRSAGAS